jgi:hypothetical protein
MSIKIKKKNREREKKSFHLERKEIILACSMLACGRTGRLGDKDSLLKIIKRRGPFVTFGRISNIESEILLC